MNRLFKHPWLIIIVTLAVTAVLGFQLGNIKMEGILIREKRMIAIKRDMIDCDYYRMLGGDVNAVNSYHGEYMKQYSWAEYTNAKLHFSDI